MAGRFPKQIDLFARHPDFELVNEQSEIAPVPLGEDISSLSAIVLDEGYYDFIGKNVLVVDGIPLTRALSVIPLKMPAHIDLNRRHAAGEHVSEKDLRKHRTDICRLVDLLPSEARLPLEGPMREDAVAFLDDFSVCAKRETSAKKRRALAKVDEIIRQTYL
ncbi:MAG: hypothetical protein IJ087_04990 [Eggerthellaceae bacterium]|nr:hypothetical protein [Eggerthellaceae bacterium]